MKIIHCADIHLGSRLESNLSSEQSAVLRREIQLTFSSMADYASNNNVRIIIIAGDLFDSGHISRKNENYVLSVVSEHPDIEFLYLKGNHDSAFDFTDQTDMPENLKIFSGGQTYLADFGRAR